MTITTISAQTILDALQCGRPSCPCHQSARRGHGLTHCPAHDDSNPSLSVSERDGLVLIYDHGGCAQRDVIQALRDVALWPERERRSSDPPPVPTRETRWTVPGNLAIHVRVDRPDGAKRMWWELPSGEKTLGGLDPATFPLHLSDRLNGDSHVTIVEGEKAGDALTRLGVPTVATYGSGVIPEDDVLRPLIDRRVYVWPDKDDAGRKHMETIAGRLFRLGCRDIRLVDWSDAPEAGDAADFAVDHDAVDVRRLMEAARRWNDPQSNEGGTRAVSRRVVTRLADVEAETARWAWHGRIPLGKLSVVDGDPGLGKSTMLLDLAARITTGKTMPDSTWNDLDGPAGVVILSAEDGLADTIRPRLDAAGADLTRIVTVTITEERGERELEIPADLDELEATIVEHHAALVIVDPLVAYLGAGVDSHRDQDVRRALSPLARVAERTGAAIIGIRHLNKMAGANAKYRGGGSIGIIGAARSGLLVAADPDDDDRRILASVKNNLAPPVPALAFRLEDAGTGVARVHWEGVTSHTAAQLLSEPVDQDERSAVDDAADVLMTILQDGPVASKDVRRQARDAGVADRTLDRAKTRLGVKAERDGFGPGGGWTWALPHSAPKDANDPQHKNVAPYGDSWRPLDIDAENGESALASYGTIERQPVNEKTASNPIERQDGHRAPRNSVGTTDALQAPRCSVCGTPLRAPESQAAGVCTSCRAAAPL